MKYKLKERVTATDLTKLGYVDNRYSLNDITYPIDVTDEGEFIASKCFPKSKVTVSLSKFTYDSMKTYVTEIECYQYEGKPHNHKKIRDVKNMKQYLQDLIDEGLLIENE